MPDDHATVTEVQASSRTDLPEGGDGTPHANNDGQQNRGAIEVEATRDSTPQSLPPRQRLEPNERPANTGGGSLRLSKRTSRPQLLSHATTAVSLADVHTQSHAGEFASNPSSPASRAVSRKQSMTHFGRFRGTSDSGGDDSGSLRSYAPTLDARLDSESLLGNENEHDATPAWRALSAHIEEHEDPFQDAVASPRMDLFGLQMKHEFDEILPTEDGASSEEAMLGTWKAKLKHFFILSASGKPIYSRHGDDQLISHYIGVAQTIISFYQGGEDPLRSFTAGAARFVILAKGPLNLVAVSRLGESEAQLRTQLESLYMQILSTLTLPSLEKIFSARPSTDLRRPLQGTDVLLDGLADGFTRGSPSTLLSALECLRLRKTHRRTINDTLLKARSPNLLYGLIVAAGRLVSVVRPKKHSLHPGDLHLIFNMLFEAGSVKAGGGENWIPLCLPGFNNTGFLYMYVSFFSPSDGGDQIASSNSEGPRPSSSGKDDELAIVLISPQKEGFYELRQMRDDLITQLRQNGSLLNLQSALRRRHATISELLGPGTQMRHFLYKSRGNVQFTMPSFLPHYEGLAARRKLLCLYSNLHEALHSKTAKLKVQCIASQEATALAWETPLFELYCVAGPKTSKNDLAQGANKIVQWVRREEERVFIIGGAVF
ncbi:hypothetical protein D0862_10333 [Hortaea werneckii]|uniref:Vacuolar fusion protein MON1 n=1 Tax=Hortaea werneckii TaxID=91943 RepID=A0A3M7FKC7_HORWE|nr:hypothetical protein D0862_10333 [Hortaea werneckii]